MNSGPRNESVIEESRLHQLERFALAAGDPDIARDARDVAARLEEGRFQVACVGQFKRGKSTLLNALVGAPVLPTGVVPVTSAITILRHGVTVSARAVFEDGHTQEIPTSDVAAYVSESANPENRKAVRGVEIFLPSPLLGRGLCLVDTPGLGSPLGGNAAVTRAFVPHIDAAIVVLGADPPISGEELDLVEEVAAQVRHLIFVLNKADRLSPEERSEGARFAATTLSRRLRRPIGPLLEVSAVERLASGAATRDWQELEHTLGALAHDAGADLVRAAEARTVERLVRALLRDLDERRAALLRPLAESETRLASLRASVESAGRALADLGVLLGAESAKLARSFRERQESFLVAAREEAHRQLAEEISALTCSRMRLRAGAFAVAQEVTRRLVERFRAELEPAADAEYRRATERFVALANEFLSRLATSGEPGLDALPKALGPESGLRAPSHLYYTQMLDRTLALTGWLTDAIRPRARTLRAVTRRSSSYLDDLIEANSSRVANDLAERAGRSRVQLESELRESLRLVTAVAERASARAQARRAEGDTAVQAELTSIVVLRSAVEALLHNPNDGGHG